MYKQLENKNFLNNQHYIVNKDIKTSLLFDYYFKKDIGLYKINIFNSLFRFVFLRIVRFFYYKDKTFINYFLLHVLIFIILSPILLFSYFSFYFSLYFYIILYLYLSFFILNLIEDFSLSKVNILSVRRKPKNKYFSFSYFNSLVENIDFSEKIFTNNIKIFLKSLFYAILTNSLVYFVYLIFLYFYA